MEPICAANERTPLLENDATLIGHRQLSRSFSTFIGQSSDENASTSDVHDAPSNLDATLVDVSVPRTAEQETDEVSLEEVVQALCSAWPESILRPDEITLDNLSEKELYIIHLAWKKVTRGRHCNSEPYIIAEAVGAALATKRNPRPEYLESDSMNLLWDLFFHADKDILAANILRQWERITDGSEFPLRYTRTIFDDSDEQARVGSKFWLRQVDLYDKIHDFIFNSKFLFLLHSLLIIWPISILTVGAKYMECPMSYHLSYLLIILGSIGCLSVVFRLALIHFTSHEGYPNEWFRQWFGLRFIELSFFTVFVTQAFHVFNTDPETEPDPKQCVENFYNTALWINYVSIAFVSAYVFVYFIKICLKQFEASYWIFRLIEAF